MIIYTRGRSSRFRCRDAGDATQIMTLIDQSRENTRVELLLSTSKLTDYSSPNSSNRRACYSISVLKSNGNTKQLRKASSTFTSQGLTPTNGASQSSSTPSRAERRPCLRRIGSRNMTRMERNSTGILRRVGYKKLSQAVKHT